MTGLDVAPRRLEAVSVEVRVQEHRPPLAVSDLVIESPSILWVRLSTEGVDGEGYAWTLDRADADRLGDGVRARLEAAVGVQLAAADLDSLLAGAFDSELNHRRARSAVECALVDAELRRSRRSLCEALGSVPRPIALYASDIYDSQATDAIRATAAGFAAAGFGGLKIRLGRRDVEWAVERLRAVRAGVGERFPLMVDAVQGWDVDFCRRMEPVLEGHGIIWLEDPFRDGDVESYRRLAGRYRVALCAGETCRSVEAVDELIATGIDIVMLDVQHLGGLDRTLDAMARVKEAGRHLTFHVFADLAASLGAGTGVEWVEWAPLWGRAAGQPRIENGNVIGGSRPGLGLWA